MNLAIFSSLPIILMSISLFFNKKQNSGKMVGGNISLPKSFWLSFTIGTWFFLPFTFYGMDVESGIMNVIHFHLLSFWIRGVLELFMIYKWFNWSPRYGISHDLFHLIGLITIVYLYWPDQITIATLLVLFFSGLLIVSTIFETVFAILFFRIRGEEKHKIYFADDSQEWKFVNSLTTIANYICYGYLFFLGFLTFELAV